MSGRERERDGGLREERKGKVEKEKLVCDVAYVCRSLQTSLLSQGDGRKEEEHERKRKKEVRFERGGRKRKRREREAHVCDIQTRTLRTPLLSPSPLHMPTGDERNSMRGRDRR